VTTANAYLNSLLTKYTPSSTYFDAARSHRSAIEKRLDNVFGLKEMFEIGSSSTAQASGRTPMLTTSSA
jgi:hypothetical protein